MSSFERQVSDAFEPRQVELLRRLVEQPSCSREPDDVEAAARIYDEAAEAVGLAVHRHADPSGRYADHRVYETPAAKSADRCLALVGHIDTVFPRSLGFFGFRREGDDAFGPGVLDMKSGLSAILFALEAIEARAELPVRVVVVSDEEVGSPSSTPLYAALAPRTSAALVFEAGRAEDALVTARKGSGAYRVEVEGRSAHSGLAHEEGVNAIAALAHLVPELEALTDYARGVTVNVGLVEGGTSRNTVPGHARCDLDVRFVDPDDGPRIDAALRRAVGGFAFPGRLSSAKATVEGHVHRPPMVPSEASRRLLARYGRHAADAGLGAGEAPLQGGGSDANLLAAAGVPTIDGLGPAGSGIHRTSERCSLDSLRRRTVALAGFLADWAGAPVL